MWIAARQDHARAFLGSSRVAVSRSRIAPEKSWLYCLRIARLTRTSSGGAGRAPPGLERARAVADVAGVPLRARKLEIALGEPDRSVPSARVGGQLGTQLA